MVTKPIEQLINDFSSTFMGDFIGVNLRNQIGFKLMTDYEDLRKQVESLLSIVKEYKGNLSIIHFL